MSEPLFQLLFLANLCTLCAGFLHSFLRRRLYSVLWGTMALLHIVSPSNFETLSNMFHPAALVQGQAYLLMANGVFLVLCVLLDPVILANRTMILTDVSVRIKRHYCNVILAAAIIAIGMRLSSGLDQAIASNWEENRTTSGWLDGLATLLGFIVYPGIWFAFRERMVARALLLSGLGAFFFQIAGSRAMILTFVCAIYLSRMLQRRSDTRQSARTDSSLWRRIVTIGIACLVAFGLHTFTRMTRGLGVSGLAEIVKSGQLTAYLSSYGRLAEIDFSGGESDTYLSYYYVVNKDSDEFPYKHWVTLKRFALLYVPQTVFPDVKPRDITYDIWCDMLIDGCGGETYYGRHVENYALGFYGSNHPTLWGDAYANGGIIGIVVYPLVFCAFVFALEVFVSRLTLVGVFMIATVMAAAYLVIGRGNVIVGVGYIGFICPLSMIIGRLAGLDLFQVRRRQREGERHTIGKRLPGTV